MALKDLVERRLRETKQTQAAAQRRGGLSKGFMYDILSGKKVAVHGANLAGLAKALKLDEGEIIAAINADVPAEPPSLDTPPPLPPTSDVRAADIHMPMQSLLRDDVPVYGTALGSIIREVQGFVFDGQQVDMVRRPPALHSAKDIYAIFVQGDSMWPAHPEGVLRFVHPHRPVLVGDTVIVQVKHHDHDPGQAYIKVLRKRLADRIVLEQYNPAATLEIGRKFIVSIHHVLTTNELFGV